MIEILKADLTGPLDGQVIANLEAGADSDVVAFALRNTTGQDVTDVQLILQTKNQAGTWVSSGLPPQDELWGRVRLTGQDATNAPTQQNLVTDWLPLGAFGSLLIPTLLNGGIRFGELRMRPPGMAAEATWAWRIAVISSERSRPVPPALAMVQHGVLTRIGDRAHNALLRGGALAASNPEDDEVHVEPAAWIQRGALRGKVRSSHALNQQDGAAQALAAGESYWAAVSLGAAVTVTKGLKAAAPVKPPAPAGDVLLGHVQVRQGASTVIEATDLAPAALFDRYFAEPAGLALKVHPGHAIAPSTWRYSSVARTVALAAEETNRLWLLASGELMATTAAEAPETGALLLWEAATDVTDVTSLTDRRTTADAPVVLHLRGDVGGAPSEVASLVVLEQLAIEAIIYRFSDNGGGSSGQTVLDVELGGDSIYVSQASDDQRPSIAFDAAILTVDGGFHETTEVRPGQVLSLLTAEHPTGGTPAWVEAYLLCRR